MLDAAQPLECAAEVGVGLAGFEVLAEFGELGLGFLFLLLLFLRVLLRVLSEDREGQSERDQRRLTPHVRLLPSFVFSAARAREPASDPG